MGWAHLDVSGGPQAVALCSKVGHHEAITGCIVFLSPRHQVCKVVLSAALEHYRQAWTQTHTNNHKACVFYCIEMHYTNDMMPSAATLQNNRTVFLLFVFYVAGDKQPKAVRSLVYSLNNSALWLSAPSWWRTSGQHPCLPGPLTSMPSEPTDPQRMAYLLPSIQDFTTAWK